MEKKVLPNKDVKRLTIERLDQEEGVVRVEQVPLSGKYSTAQFIKELAQKEKEELDWWDIDHEETITDEIEAFSEKLGLRKEDEKLEENMVFWKVELPGKKTQIFHATQPARELSRNLYTKLTERQESGKE